VNMVEQLIVCTRKPENCKKWHASFFVVCRHVISFVLCYVSSLVWFVVCFTVTNGVYSLSCP